ncbi:hypothetical protein G6011_00073 [Alternaria panax]|uniref:HD/PDEase domain-containing protein n=1 Tax=Alternaria panax TaxID=48097 RepID=A0AAD4II80_9PLEO|nr:hypothetical protein G6011_00073 [Alternaria panax]
MRLFSSVVPRRFYSSKTAEKLTSTPKRRPTVAFAKLSSAPIADALELSVSYAKMGTLTEALPKPSRASGSISTAVKSIEVKYPLFNMDALGIKPKDREWFTAVNLAVRTHMNKLDASHNYEHIRRVVSNAAYILEEEKKQHQWARDLDHTAIWITCMTHDIGDKKYGTKGGQSCHMITVRNFLNSLGCSSDICMEASLLAPRVSFTAEMLDEAHVGYVADEWPTLRIVQDADRLDGLGAIGVGRLFVYGGANKARRQGSIDSGIELIEQRFKHYSRLMKTETGRKMAEERYKWMVEDFVRRWKVEANTSNV